MVRVAKQEDKQKFMELWKTCFHDSDSFCNWLFTNRFYPSYSACVEVDEAFVSSMQAVPYTVRVRGKNLTGCMLCGISTHPDYRGKGYMKKMVQFHMQQIAKLGCGLAVHTPAVLESYFSIGHLPVADAYYYEGHSFAKEEQKATLLEKEDWHRLFPLYQREIVEKYSTCIARTQEEFLRKGDDYGADGAKCLVLQDETIRGYAFFYDYNSEITAVEVVAEVGYYESLLAELFSWKENTKVSAKLPTCVDLEVPFATKERKQKGVAGLVSAKKFLEELQLNCPYTMEIVDTFVAENNGIFTFSGQKSTKPPVIKWEVSTFVQVLVGYYSLDEVREKIEVFDEEAFSYINQMLPKEHCYIIDEY